MLHWKGSHSGSDSEPLLGEWGGGSVEGECLPREKMKVLAYVKGSKHDWDLPKIESTNYSNV